MSAEIKKATAPEVGESFPEGFGPQDESTE